MTIPIIIGSPSDLTLARKIQNELLNYDLNSNVRICSAHKAAHLLTKMLDKYEESGNVKLYITIAGKSNALSSLIDGYVSCPVISCPPITDANIHDLHSSTSMPSYISPLVVLGYKNAALAAAKIIGNTNSQVKKRVIERQTNNKIILKIDDIKVKYDIYDNLINQVSKKDNNDNCDKNNSFYTGKVRYLCNTNKPNQINMIATDRLSAFDTSICNIPFKGRIINEISCWWLNKTRHIIDNHLISHSGESSMLVKRCKVYPIEVIVRAYMTGSTNTSIWVNYSKGSRNYCGHKLPDFLRKNQELPELLITPTTKGETDLLIDEQYILEHIMPQKEWDFIKEKALELFRYGQSTVDKNGLILVDTKYEFGKDENGNIILVDELHTPDSSRYWLKPTYKERFTSGQEPQNIDKEFIRKLIKKKCVEENIDVYKNPDLLPSLITTDMVIETTKKYMQLYELITDEEFINFDL